MPRILFRFLITIFACVLAFPVAAGADITRFDLSGTVTDGTGGVLPGVAVSLKNADTGFNRSTVTDAEGRFSVENLLPGGYRVDNFLFKDGKGAYVPCGTLRAGEENVELRRDE